MKQYLLDTNILGAYLLGRKKVSELAREWIQNNEAATSIVTYGEVCEYLKSFPDSSRRLANLRVLLQKVYPYPLTYSLLEKYAEIRRTMRPPYGTGHIGDIDTLIAATALDNYLTLVTTDSDFKRVPGLSLLYIPRADIK
jgi:predicted nucleic acid-binding protein